MTAQLLDGRAIARKIQSDIKQRVDSFVERHHRPPVLAAVLVGDDPASHVYVRNKEKACRRAGIESQLHRLPGTISTAELLQTVGRLNEDSRVNGILVQLPLPGSVDSQSVLDAIDPAKDVDAFHPHNVGLLSQGRPRFLPCTPHGILQILFHSNITTAGQNVCVLGRSDIVGKPMALMLAQRDSGLGPDMGNATVTLCHSRTDELATHTSAADILIAAIGRPEFVTGNMIKKGAVVVDVGINRTEQGLVGDVNFAEASEIASHITPVPGGVGPLTVTMLLENTLSAALDQI